MAQPAGPSADAVGPLPGPLTHSEMQTFRTCRRRWHWAYRDRYDKKPEVQPATGVAQLGTNVHLSLEGHYTGLDALDVLAVIYDDLQDRRPEDHHDIALERGYAFTMVKGYLEWVAETGVDAQYAVVGTELDTSADVWLPGGGTVTLRGKLDQVIERRDGSGARLVRDFKPQPLDSLVLTPTGWVRMGEIRVGTVVSGAHGEAVTVTNVYDRGTDQVFRVELNDGTTVRATSDHPWWAQRTVDQEIRLVETSRLRAGSRIAAFTPEESGPPADLPLDPYLLGAWLANGDRRGRSIVDGEAQPLHATGLEVISTQRPGRAPLFEARLTAHERTALSALDLLLKYSAERSIPMQYVHKGSYAQRLALFQGLMDGDGSFSGKYRSSAKYHTVSKQLALDVAELARSLGAWAKVWVYDKPTYTGTHQHIVTVRSAFNPFRESKHAPVWELTQGAVRNAADRGERRQPPRLEKIVRRVVPDGTALVRCIELDSAEHLYVTDGYTVTHNTVGSLTKADGLDRDTQMRTYDLLHYLSSPQDTITDGVLYTMLLRSKRTARATPPFYGVVHRAYNHSDRQSALEAVQGTAMDIMAVDARLAAGEPSRRVLYANPGDYCSWGCPFVSVCHMADDGSRITDALAEGFVKADPWDHYGTGRMDAIRAALGGRVGAAGNDLEGNASG